MKVLDLKKIVKDGNETNIQKLLDSHNVKDDDDVVELVYEIIDDSGDFFSDEKMPKSWGKRTCSSAMESMYNVMSDPIVKELLVAEIEQKDYVKLLSVLNQKRKDYMNIYKKEQRKKQKVTDKPPQSDDTTMPSELLVDIDTLDNEVQHITAVKGDGDSVMEVFANAKFHREKCDSDGDMISKQCIIEKTKKISELLSKYMSHEPDEFKVLFLEVIQDELDNIYN